MAYDRNKILIFGGAGVVIAAFLILLFIPGGTETHVATTVSLQEIPGYGFQIVKMSEERDDITQLEVTLEGFEFRKSDGSWIDASGERFSFDLIRELEISFTVDVGELDAGSYNGVRFRVVPGFGFTNATLSSGKLVTVDSPQTKVAYVTSTFELDENMETLQVELNRGAGVISNYMLPELHLAIMTTGLDITIS